MKNNELWKSVNNYNGIYEVSNLGNIRNAHTGRILKTSHSVGGYEQVVLCKNGKTTTHYVHRLVATAFIDNPNNLPCVNHKDENTGNNVLENLEWISYKDNANYGTKNERISNARKDVYTRPVMAIDKDGKFAIYASLKSASVETGVGKQNIYNCLKGYYKNAGGLRWLYADYSKKVDKLITIVLNDKNIIS